MLTVSFRQLNLLLLFTLGGIALAYTNRLPLVIGFLPGFCLLVYLSLRVGLGWTAIFLLTKKGITRTKNVLGILAFVGLLIPAWMASGTIPLLIKLGVALLQPDYFLTYSFLILAVVSLILGSSTAALSTVGVALLGVGVLLGVPLPMTAGALISGAFVGDRTSPLSSAHQLVASCTQVNLTEHLKALLPTTGAALFLSLLFFLGLDLKGGWTLTKGGLTEYSFEGWFQLHLLLLLPVVLLMGAIILRRKAALAFSLAILCGVFLALFYQQVNWYQLISFLFWGYDFPNLSLLHSKGIVQMIPLMLLIALSGAYNQILEESKLIQPYLEKILASARNLGSATWRVCLFGLAVGMVSCNQTLPIMVSGINLLPSWQEKFASNQLARAISDSSLVLAGLIPWNMLALLCASLLHVDVLAYLPYAIFLWSLPFLTVFLSYYQTKQWKSIYSLGK